VNGKPELGVGLVKGGRGGNPSLEPQTNQEHSHQREATDIQQTKQRAIELANSTDIQIKTTLLKDRKNHPNKHVNR